MAQKSSRPQQAKANAGVERHMGFSVVAFVIGGVVVVALWCVSGGVAAPAVALRDIGASDWVSLPLLLSLRLLCASVALYTLLGVYFNRAGLRMSYQEATVHISRLRRWTTFTVWCFTALLLYFALSAFCSAMLMTGRGEQVPAAVAQTTLILFARELSGEPAGHRRDVICLDSDGPAHGLSGHSHVSLASAHHA